MDYTQKTDKATYLLQKFLASDHSHDFAILPIDVFILLMICRYLDMKGSKCFAKQKTLANECRIKLRHFQDRCDYLQRIGLLFRYFRGRSYQYELGYVITGIEEYV